MGDIECFVPSCSNNSRDNPDRLFVPILERLREEWCRQVKVECLKKYLQYCCEDHLNRDDIKNYYKCKLMNELPKMSSNAQLRRRFPLAEPKKSILCDLLLQDEEPKSFKLKKRKLPSTAPSTLSSQLEQDLENYQYMKLMKGRPSLKSSARPRLQDPSMNQDGVIAQLEEDVESYGLKKRIKLSATLKNFSRPNPISFIEEDEEQPSTSGHQPMEQCYKHSSRHEESESQLDEDGDDTSAIADDEEMVEVKQEVIEEHNMPSDPLCETKSGLFTDWPLPFQDGTCEPEVKEETEDPPDTELEDYKTLYFQMIAETTSLKAENQRLKEGNEVFLQMKEEITSLKAEIKRLKREKKVFFKIKEEMPILKAENKRLKKDSHVLVKIKEQLVILKAENRRLYEDNIVFSHIKEQLPILKAENRRLCEENKVFSQIKEQFPVIKAANQRLKLENEVLCQVQNEVPILRAENQRLKEENQVYYQIKEEMSILKAENQRLIQENLDLKAKNINLMIRIEKLLVLQSIRDTHLLDQIKIENDDDDDD